MCFFFSHTTLAFSRTDIKLSIRQQYDFVRIFKVEISNTLALDEEKGYYVIFNTLVLDSLMLELKNQRGNMLKMFNELDHISGIRYIHGNIVDN